MHTPTHAHTRTDQSTDTHNNTMTPLQPLFTDI